MLVLDQGDLSGFACGQRMGIVFLGAILAQIAMVGLGYYWTTKNQIETLDTASAFTPSRIFLVGIWVLITAIVATVCMFLRTETLIAADNDFVIETSCHGPFANEYRLDRSKTVVHYITEISTGWRHSVHAETHETNYLALEEAGKDRQLYIILDGSAYVSNLEQFSPRAIKSYRDYLKQRQQLSSPTDLPKFTPSPQVIVRTP